jgi:hypothetical protein
MHIARNRFHSFLIFPEPVFKRSLIDCMNPRQRE